ncbi:hypothetical protein [Desulfovibrio litoralis]|uniref:Uncharacterized protein n=1 Tax=Desulfovibrio litoralis DSM 11393 TaxID=1121455 RepID=A0A1M7S0S0_9BACT|nr:hypothetical protein [Desulfovibrio litoralis]SHN51922.1 hypothetical protein SAMN02745728_00397 [Desulfovibrio litoralis DSM 11393]
MSNDLLTYKELAFLLKLSPGTVRNIWRQFPYVPITPNAQEKPNLRGVRFILEDVLEHCKQQKQVNYYGNTHNTNSNRNKVHSLLQVSRETDQQKIYPQAGSNSMGSGREKTVKRTGGKTNRFDVFANN